MVYILYATSMKNGRINERNIGNHKLDGGAKRAKSALEPVLSDEQYNAQQQLRDIKMLLHKGVKIYDGVIPELIQHWINNGIAELKEFENSCIMARKDSPTEIRAILIEEKRNDVEFVKNLLILTYNL